MKRLQLGDTSATRAPSGTRIRSSASAIPRARAAISRYVIRPSEPGVPGSSTTARRSGYTVSARSRKSPTVSGTFICLPSYRWST